MNTVCNYIWCIYIICIFNILIFDEYNPNLDNCKFKKKTH
jgi:hypothetical protein